MTALGWILVFAGLWILRAVFRGQVLDSDGKFDLTRRASAELVAFVNGDTKALTGLDEPGPGLGSVDKGVVATASGERLTRQQPDLLTAAKARAKRANYKYVYAATGPDAYDCSGLVWRCCQDVRPDLKSLPRFSTFTMLLPPWKKHFYEVSAGRVNSIVLWRTHMGIVTGPDTYYSARTAKLGIGESKISNTFPNEKPTYWGLRFAKDDPS